MPKIIAKYINIYLKIDWTMLRELGLTIKSDEKKEAIVLRSDFNMDNEQLYKTSVS